MEEKYVLNPDTDKSHWEIDVEAQYNKIFTKKIKDGEILLVDERGNNWIMENSFLKEHFIKLNPKISSWKKHIRGIK